MTLRSLIDDVDASEYAIAVVGEDGPGPLAELLESTFEAQSIDVERGVPDGAPDTAVFDPDDGDLAVLLEDTRMRLRGYPLAHREKLLLILVSRYVEQLAWSADGGTLRTAFQRLSRLDDELDTRDVYVKLADSDVDALLYGADDGTTIDLEATVHTGERSAYRDGWFVVYRHDDRDAGDAAALVCLEVEHRVWEGFWTTDPARVAEVAVAISRDL